MGLNEGDLYSAIEAFLADTPYYPCCLLVSPDIARLRMAQEFIERRYSWPTLSTGAELSDALLLHTPESRSRAVKPLLESLLQQRAEGMPVLCMGIDILFEPSLALDPLSLLRDLSRSVRLVVAWPGAIAGGQLSYAVAGHARYRTWPASDLSPRACYELQGKWIN